MSDNNEQPQKESFLKDVAEHSMNIIRDDGVYRHLVFSNNGSSIYRFEIITWPGYLCYTGDMGAFVFTRVQDMFTFFRNTQRKINPCYWAEKVVAENKPDGVEAFSIEKFRNNVLASTRAHLSIEDNEEIPSNVLDEIAPILEAQDFIDAIGIIRDFRSDEIDFNDWWEFRNKKYTYAFIWCCYALVWAIEQYDTTHKHF
ncbi:MAG TPA: hypothetical protein DCG54_09660 [Anaerolineae bacterium]|jgi:hypothetical protein|nr:hypothetical protein [Anaerolineae bacterium]